MKCGIGVCSDLLDVAPKTQTTKGKMDKQLKASAPVNVNERHQGSRKTTRNGSKCWRILYLTRDLYVEYIKTIIQ